VRSFYKDLATLAAEDPPRWAPWAAPCPIRANECQDRKARARSKAARDHITRALMPALPALVDAVTRNRDHHSDILRIARQQPPGEQFNVDGRTFTRLPNKQSDRVYVIDHRTGRRRDATAAEERAFWAWAMVEILRHTGVRIEELLELTHHSFAAYTLPSTREVAPMLQIAPSKTDTERLLLVSPELGEVLATVIARVRGPNTRLPLVCRYDYYERVWSAPLPHLLQRQQGAEHRHITAVYLRHCLDEAVADAGLLGPEGTSLHFTPHDFRRIFTTDAIRSGLPPHIAAKILGHADVNVTLGYAAIYPDDVIAHHRAFIANRRTLRLAGVVLIDVL
jgi:integrase